MSQILEHLEELGSKTTAPWLKSIQDQGLPDPAQNTWPDRKTEDWKYTNLNSVIASDYFSLRATLSPIEDINGLNEQLSISDLPCHRLVFVNGCFSSELSIIGDLPEALDLVLFSEANSDQQSVIAAHLDTIVDNAKHVFSGVNKQLLNDGVLLHVKKNVVVKKPIQVVWLSTESDKACHIPQRMLAVIDANAEATLFEQFLSVGDKEQNCLTHGITELSIGDGGRLHHYRFHQEAHGALHIGGVHVSLKRNAFLNGFHMALGGKLKRIDITVNHDGEGANCILNGVYLPQQDQHVDYHTCIEHRVPHCTTSENYRGIVGGNGRAVFNGRIHIHPDAQKTLAELSNKNLLTSNKAEVDSKPELEIYADDVQCAHGTTVAQLDDKALHYFLTRGISRDKAEVMLSFGFIKELIDEVTHKPLVDYLTPLVRDLFAQDPALARGEL